MPKFKYTPNKNNAFNVQQNTETISEQTNTVVPTPIKPVRPTVNIPEQKVVPSAKKEPIIKKDAIEQDDLFKIVPKTETRDDKPLKIKVNKKLLVYSLLVVLVICSIIFLIKHPSKPKYDITSQNIGISYGQEIKEGALMDVKNSVPLNLPIRDLNISIDKTKDLKEVTVTLWDFTDTNQNKIAVYINGDLYKKAFELTKKPVKIKMPVDAKFEIMQTETVNSPYTPYAIQVNGMTYFNRVSFEKINQYQFLLMEEKRELTLDDFTSDNTSSDEE